MNIENVNKAKELLAEIEKLEFFLNHEGWESPDFKLASPVLLIQKTVEYRLPEGLKQKIKSIMEEYLEEKKERLK